VLRRFAPLALALLSVYLAIPTASAQQVASQYVCGPVLLDGGSTNAVCGTFLSNYEPYTITCEVNVPAGDKSSAGATVNILASGNGTNYGTWADAGLSVVIVANGDAGAVTTTAALAVYPTNPWLNQQVYISGIATDGGTSSQGNLACQISVIQSQTLHAKYPGGLKGSLPKAKRVIQ
jgi:hypothetical protein